MTISELITQLEQVRAEHGDRSVVICTDYFFGQCDQVTDVDFIDTSGNVRLSAY